MNVMTKVNENPVLPSLIVIGAQKCGTTSLHFYLSLHPQILMSEEKELNFFIKERNWNKGLEWYASSFEGKKAKIYGESSPAYTNYPLFTGVPARMHTLVPKAKLLYIVRDPIERMISHYIHVYSLGIENRSIEEALASSDSGNEYLYRSLYYTQLEQYLMYYPQSQILVISKEDLENHRRKTLSKVFKFLDVDLNFHSYRYLLRWHSTSRKRRKTETGMRLSQLAPARLLEYLPIRFRWPIQELLYLPFSRKIERPKLSEALRQELTERLKEDINKLRILTGYNFENWCL
ncbi:MAG TPA: sulfotransferase [Thermodesulfobacteriota bacterium]|nr:sulfotransferase [Thermodesulfobacteriota bacterium]